MAKTTATSRLVMPTAKTTSKKQRKQETKKLVDAELERIAKMKSQKRKATIEAIHKKSGFTDYIRRAPGSYEGGNK